MHFDPLNRDHAVQIVVFTLLFDGAFQPTTLQALRSVKELLIDLPAVQAPEVFEVEATISGAPTLRRVQGTQLSHLRPDGTPAWSVRLIGNQLAVECTRYTRWEKVWGVAHKYLQVCLRMLSAEGESRKLLVVGQNFVDAFLANQEDFDVGTLLKRGPMIAEKIFSAGPTWHSHVGWFERSDAYGVRIPCLNQLNLDAIRSQDGPTPTLKITIAHNQELRLQQSVPIEEGDNELDGLMTTLHMHNKRVLKELLTAQMAARIGLEDSDVATPS
jgi:uncharacterized protein (TIGR04255 family)